MEALLNWMIFLPTLGAHVCLLPMVSKQASKQVALITSIVTFGLSVCLARAYYLGPNDGVAFETACQWIAASTRITAWAWTACRYHWCC